MASSSSIFLSVLLPVYRADISGLLVQLGIQLEKIGRPYEIIVLDDSADEQYFAWHAAFKTSPKLRILTSSANKGRSASRNFLMQEAQGSHWLLLDGDMSVSKNFIQTYFTAIDEQPDKVWVGGISYDLQASGLRALVGAEREQIAASIRQKHPYRAFTAANVVLPAVVLSSIRFDERIVTYGHEDTVFGLALAEHNIPVLHLDNPATHLGLEDDESYFRKIEESISTLAALWHNNELIRKYAHEIKLLRVWKRLRIVPLGIMPVSNWLLQLMRNKAKKGILWLDSYKLLYLHLQIKQHKRRL